MLKFNVINRLSNFSIVFFQFWFNIYTQTYISPVNCNSFCYCIFKCSFLENWCP